MIVKILKRDGNATIPYKTHGNDFCFDCVATSKEVIGNKIVYGLGFSLQFEQDDLTYKSLENDFILSFDFRARSSIHKTGLSLSNGIGTGDEGYTGEYKVVFYIIDPLLNPYEIGDRICQLKVGLTPRIQFKEVSILEETTRGVGGFGSTGK